MSPSGQIPERVIRRVGWMPCATIPSVRWLMSMGLAVLVALLTAGPAKSQTSVAATGTCSPFNGVSGYPKTAQEWTGPNLYRLDRPEPAKYATNAILEYMSAVGPVTTADQRVAAIAWYVDKHMSWRDDTQNEQAFTAKGYPCTPPLGADFPQPADLTLAISGKPVGGVPQDDFIGDCEDFAILRAALLRVPVPIAPTVPSAAIWNVIDQKVSHEYNAVKYNKGYRLMDYGNINRWLMSTPVWDAHQSYFAWNFDLGPRGWPAPTASPDNHTDLVNNTNNCPAPGTKCKDWGYLNYYKDICPCP